MSKSILIFSLFITFSFLLYAESVDDKSDSSNSINPDNPQSVEETTSANLIAESANSQALQLIQLRKLLDDSSSRLTRLKGELKAHKREFAIASEQFSKIDKELQQLNVDEADNEQQISEIDRRKIEFSWQRARDEFDFVITLTQLKESLVSIVEGRFSALEAARQRLLNPDAYRKEMEQKLLAGNTENNETTNAQDSAISFNPLLPTLLPSSNSNNDTATIIQSAQLRFDYRSADAAKEVNRRQIQLAIEDSNAELIDLLGTLSTNELTKVEELSALYSNHAERIQSWLNGSQIATSEEGSTTRVSLSSTDIVRLEKKLTSILKTVHILEQDAELNRNFLLQLEGARTKSGLALDRAEEELEAAIRKLELVQSPLAPHRIKRWLFSKLPGMLLTILILFTIWFVLRLATQRFIKVLEVGSRRGSKQERKERAETIHRVFRNVLTVVIFGLGVILVLDQAGIDVTVLLGSAALVGVAITFGAQSLIKDYFHGALVLIEDQYRVGNIIRVGDVVGTVEDITLRMMAIRDLSGTLHFIPHGQVASISNLTYGWARVVFDIGIAYKESVDKTIELLLQLANELKQDKEFGKYIVGEPEMLGVDEFADSAVVIRFLVTTKPLKQWMIKRELLRRIKNAFDERGIEIPFPHRTVYIPDSVNVSDMNDPDLDTI